MGRTSKNEATARTEDVGEDAPLLGRDGDGPLGEDAAEGNGETEWFGVRDLRYARIDWRWVCV